MDYNQMLWGWIFFGVLCFWSEPLFDWICFFNTIIHELGHFCAAKLCGLKVTLLKIGAGKPIFKRKLGKTTFILAKCLGSKRGRSMVCYKMRNDNFKGLCVAFAGPGSSLLFVTLYLALLKIYTPIPTFLLQDPWLIMYWIFFTIVLLPSIFLESFVVNLMIDEDNPVASHDGCGVAISLVGIWIDRFKKSPPKLAVEALICLIPLLPLTLWGAAIVMFFWRA